MKNLNEIDIFELLKKVYSERKFIIYFSLFFSIIGIIISLNTPNQYTSSTVFIPQINTGVESSSSGFSGLASLAGINIGGMNNSNNFPTDLYPQVIESFPFKIDLLSSIIKFDKKELSVKQYLLDKEESKSNVTDILYKYTIGLPRTILNIFSKSNPSQVDIKTEIYSISERDDFLFKKISDNCKIDINKKEGFIAISYTDENKLIAAQITEIAQSLLQEKIIQFKNQSSKELLDFTLNQYNEKKSFFEKLQDQKAIFIDQNLNISSSLYKNKLFRIESELEIYSSIVKQLASQVEQARLQVNKNTPVFTTIQPVTIPFERTAPKRTLIVLTYLFISLVIAILYVLIKDPIFKIIKLIKS